MSDLLPRVEVETGANPDAAVIWLHGLGADGHDFEALVPALTLKQDLHVRFVFPHAPHRPVTINGGMTMRAWYDILEMTLERKVDMDNIRESAQQIEGLIEDQIGKGIAADRIVLAGFSQGGVIAYQVALHTPHKLAGVMALSTYLVNHENIPSAEFCPNGKTPFLIHHGSQDPIVAPSLGVQAEQLLSAEQYEVRYQSYPMPHAVCPEQVTDISAWLNERLA